MTSSTRKRYGFLISSTNCLVRASLGNAAFTFISSMFTISSIAVKHHLPNPYILYCPVCPLLQKFAFSPDPFPAPEFRRVFSGSYCVAFAVRHFICGCAPVSVIAHCPQSLYNCLEGYGVFKVHKKDI